MRRWWCDSGCESSGGGGLSGSGGDGGSGCGSIGGGSSGIGGGCDGCGDALKIAQIKEKDTEDVVKRICAQEGDRYAG
ncbi:hypothetical protein LSH36_89g04064 [Paralvinella palmiformis]|uniref:Uncharacterized protein n=1 Tax=Paralvinella palmiformis TaxID=53620 RepID=A0AAD9NAI6_9ANNE|nr:hypothetical protein LSH36_89g04064 [Paralvinella palmiformis]